MRLYELKEARKQQDVTQKQLAERMGVSQKRVSSLESGDVDKTEIRTLRRYLDAIGGRLQVNAIMPDGRTLQLVCDQVTRHATGFHPRFGFPAFIHAL